MNSIEKLYRGTKNEGQASAAAEEVKQKEKNINYCLIPVLQLPLHLIKVQTFEFD